MPKVIARIDTEGNETITSVDLLDDYWFDYLFFRRDARTANRNRDPLKVQRYLRAGLFSLLNYLTGLVNRWQASFEGLNSQLPEATLEDRFITLSKQLGGAPPPSADLASLTCLVSRCANLQPRDESDLFFALSLETVEAAEQRIIFWLEEFSRATGLLRYSATRLVGLSIADELGIITQESYQSFDALGDDLHPFQDDPDSWGEPAGQQPDGQDQN